MARKKDVYKKTKNKPSGDKPRITQLEEITDELLHHILELENRIIVLEKKVK